MRGRISDLSLKEVRHKFGGPGVSDEELTLRVIAGEAAVKAMLAAGAPKEYLAVTQPFVGLLDDLSKRRDLRQVYIQKKSTDASDLKKKCLTKARSFSTALEAAPD